jgi:hypothetical protein
MTSKQLVTTEPQADGPSVAWWNPLHWPAGIWVLLIALGLMTTPFVIRAIILAGIPEMPEPFDEIAYSTWEVPAIDDAFTYYREAAALHQKLVADLKAQGITDIREPEDSLLILQEGWSEATDSTKKWLELHQESLAAWRRGTEKDQGLNVLPSKLTIDSIWNVVQEQRKFVRLAILEESRLIASGELDEARQWARAGFRSGGHTSNRGCIMQGLVGVAIHTVSSQGLARWAEHPGVTSAQLQQALVEVRSDEKLYESLSNILKSEYLYMRNVTRSSDWNLEIAPTNPSGATSAAEAKIMKMLYWTVGEPEVCARIMRQILANQLPEIDKPIALRRKMVGSGATLLFELDPSISLPEGQLDPAGIERAIKRSSLTRMVLAALDQLDIAFLRRQARQATLEALLATQAYRRDHGEFPESLAQLVPKYLAAVPLDPCDPARGPLLYRRDEPAKAVVWSVSQDQADDGGDIDTTKGLAPDLGFELK